MSSGKRPDLSERHILQVIVAFVLVGALTLVWPDLPAPGSPSGQLCAAMGSLLLLAPLLFLAMKRSGMSDSPPTWFVVHVLATVAGCCLIFIHVASGDWISPPGVILLLLVLLVLHGSLLRALLSRGFSLLFARTSLPTGFSTPATLDKSALQQLINAKAELLQTLDPGAEEALFSPALKDWLRRPLQSFRYQRLAEREAEMVGARVGAGIGLRWSRRLHMAAALAFYAGLLTHIIVVLFFAGYAAGGEPIGWWHVTAWGG